MNLHVDPATLVPRKAHRKYPPAEIRIQRVREFTPDTPKLDNPALVYPFWQAVVTAAPWYNPDVEMVVAMSLNARCAISGYWLVSIGTVNTSLVHAREVFKTAILLNAHSVLLAHNHPSGDTTPSEDDVRVTRNLVKAGTLLNIALLDHVVIGQEWPDKRQPWTSLRELGYFAY